jgi:hypothetical protein
MATGPASTHVSRRGLFAVIVVLVVAPLAVAAFAALRTHWYPTLDDALEILRIRDVGGRHTPLTGAQSRFGWDHPGPMLFWILAPARWIGGDNGVLAGVTCINGAAIVGSLFLARRRGGLAFTVLVAVALLVLLRGLGGSLLVDVWNPWVAVLPFFAYVLLAWSVAERDFFALPLLVLVGSYLVQTHVGYLPLVASLAVTGGILAAVWAARQMESRAVLRWLALAAAVGIIAWIPPIVQQLTGHPGNLGDIFDYFTDSKNVSLGASYGFGVMGRELPFAWIRGNDINALGFVAPASTLPALAFLAITLAAGILAGRRGTPSAGRFAVLLIAAVVAGIGAGARINGIPGTYLMRWWWVIAAALWCSVAWSLWAIVSGLRAASTVRALAWAAVVVVAIGSLLVAVDATSATVPAPALSAAVHAIAPPTAAALAKDRPYVVTWIDSRDLGAVGQGVYLALAERGYDVKVLDFFKHSFGSWRVAPLDGVDALVTVVLADDAAKFDATPGTTKVASYDPLNAGERARADELEREMRARAGPALRLADVDTAIGRVALARDGVSTAVLDELAALRRRGIAYDVYVSPTGARGR